MNFDTATKTYEAKPRLSGILLHPTSLPSPYGIGELGQEGIFVFFIPFQPAFSVVCTFSCHEQGTFGVGGAHRRL